MNNYNYLYHSESGGTSDEVSVMETEQQPLDKIRWNIGFQIEFRVLV